MIIKIEDIEGRKLSRVDVSVVFEDGESVSYSERSKQQETVRTVLPGGGEIGGTEILPPEFDTVSETMTIKRVDKPIPPEMKELEF